MEVDLNITILISLLIYLVSLWCVLVKARENRSIKMKNIAFGFAWIVSIFITIWGVLAAVKYQNIDMSLLFQTTFVIVLGTAILENIILLARDNYD